jgi:hypothetical protein
MGLIDILNSMQNGPRGQSQPSSAGGGGGMSPMMMALIGVLAHKALKAFTEGQSPSPVPGGQRGPALGGGTVTAGNPGTGLGDLLGGLFGGSPGGSPAQGKPGGRLSDLVPGGLGNLLGGAGAGSVLSGGLDKLVSWSRIFRTTDMVRSPSRGWVTTHTTR